MNFPYNLWPIWCDYLEEQGQNTELLRYVMTYGVFNSTLALVGFIFVDVSPFLFVVEDVSGLPHLMIYGKTEFSISKWMIRYENSYFSSYGLWEDRLGSGTLTYYFNYEFSI